MKKLRAAALLMAVLLSMQALVSCSESGNEQNTAAEPAEEIAETADTAESTETADETDTPADTYVESEPEETEPAELTEGQAAINAAKENIIALGLGDSIDFSHWTEAEYETVIEDMKALYASKSDVYKETTFLPDARNIYLYVCGKGVKWIDLFPESSYSDYIENSTYTEMLSEAVASYNSEYYNKSGLYKNADFWDYAEIFELIEDAYETTGDETYLTQITQMGNYILKVRKDDWKSNEYNDDIMWLCIAMTRAYNYTGTQEYLDAAVKNYAMVIKRASSDDLGGGLFWRTDNQSKNVCVNCPAAVAAMYLAKATGDDSYYDTLYYCLSWVIDNMFEKSNGKVYDSMSLDGTVNKWSSTYNQGTFIGACLAYYEYTGNSDYLTYAQSAAKYVKKNMYANGIMDNEESGNDLPGFKGILARYIRMYYEFTGNATYMDWLRENADSAYENRNSKGLMNTQFKTKTTEKSYDVFTMSSAVSVIANSVGVTVVKETQQ